VRERKGKDQNKEKKMPAKKFDYKKGDAFQRTHQSEQEQHNRQAMPELITFKFGP